MYYITAMLFSDNNILSKGDSERNIKFQFVFAPLLFAARPYFCYLSRKIRVDRFVNKILVFFSACV